MCFFDGGGFVFLIGGIVCFGWVECVGCWILFVIEVVGEEFDD